MAKNSPIDIGKIVNAILVIINKYHLCEQSSEKNYFSIVLNKSTVYRFVIFQLRKITKEDVSSQKHVNIEKIELFLMKVLKNQSSGDSSENITLQTESGLFSFSLKAIKDPQSKTFSFLDDEYHTRKYKMTISDEICRFIAGSKTPLCQSDITLKFKNKTTSDQRKRILSILETENKIKSSYDRTKGRMKKVFYTEESL